MNKQEIIELIKGTATATFILPGLGETTIPTIELKPMVESWENQLTNGWIPCSERLPDKTDEYLCTVEWYGTSTKKQLIENNHIIEKRVINVYFLESISAFKEQDGFCTYEVIAWQPLPEAYREVLK